MQINRAYTQLREQTQYYWHLPENLSATQLQYTPQPDVWSVAQVINHLAAAEKLTVDYLIGKNYTAINHRGWPGAVRYVLLKYSLRSRLKFKAPAIAQIALPMQIKVEETVQNWEHTHERLRNYIANFPPDMKNQYVFRHPRAGALTLAQTLGFMYWHQKHHVPQVKKILAGYTAQQKQKSNNLI